MKKKLIIIAVCFYAATAVLAGTGTATKVKVQSRVDEQRAATVLAAGELNFIPDSPSAPLAVGDGVTTGGVQMVSVFGALPRVSTVTITNDAEWLGWTSTGELRTNGTIFLAAGEWLESPRLAGGVNSYDTSAIYSDQGATGWSVVLYTNSTATPVSAPYVGTDARLRITEEGSIGIMGEGEVGVKIPSISIESFSDPSLLQPGSYIPNNRVVSPPVDAEQIARLDTVTSYHATAQAYTDTEIIKYDRDADKVVRGSMVFAGSGWAFYPTRSDTNATISLSWGGFPMLDFSLAAAGCQITTFVPTNNTVMVGIATNDVATAPVLEYCTDLMVGDWLPVSVVSNTYPSLVSGAYQIVADQPDGDAIYFRALRLNGESKTTIKSDVLDVGSGVIRFHGSVGGTNRVANLSWDFTNNAFRVEVNDVQ